MRTQFETTKAVGRKIEGPYRKLAMAALHRVVLDVQNTPNLQNVESYIDAWMYICGKPDELYSFASLVELLECDMKTFAWHLIKRDRGVGDWIDVIIPREARGIPRARWLFELEQVRKIKREFLEELGLTKDG